MLLASPTPVEPFAFGLGPLQITGFGLAVVAAFAIAQVVVVRELARRGHQDHAYAAPDVVLAALVGTLVGAKLYFVALTGDVSSLWSRGGFVFWGGFMGSVLFCWLLIRAKRLSFARYADVAGIAIAAGYAVGRTGCWAVGDDYGRPWSGPLAVTFPDGAPATTAANLRELFGAVLPAGTPPDALVAVHPTQLYETAMGLAMFAVLWRLRAHRHAEGWLFGAYCVLAGAERFVVEFVRAKDDRFVGPLTSAQMIALTVAAVGLVIMRLRSAPGPGRPGIYADGAADGPAPDLTPTAA
jgi:phosphatidylglycerol:prolipoprotein diacylglycerol transferase